MKICSKCLIEKPKDAFGFRSDKPHLLRSHCNKCICDRQKLRQERQNFLRKERYKSDEKFKENCKAEAKQYFANNSESRKKAHKAWISKNKVKQRSYTRSYVAKRRAEKIKATPKWAVLKDINEFYKNCPEGHHVDHVVPLKGKNVCGLHVSNNLQYLPARDNLIKGNKF